MRFRAVLAAAALLAACGSDGASSFLPEQESSGPFELSAEGYGPIRVGMSLTQARAALGATRFEPIVSFAEPEPCTLMHVAGTADGGDGLILMVRGGRVTRISDYEARDAATAAGIGLGDSDAAIRAAYPNAAQSEAPYAAPPAHDLVVWTSPEERGLRFEINAEGVAVAVHAGDESILLAEGCI